MKTLFNIWMICTPDTRCYCSSNSCLFIPWTSKCQQGAIAFQETRKQTQVMWNWLMNSSNRFTRRCRHVSALYSLTWVRGMQEERRKNAVQTLGNYVRKLTPDFNYFGELGVWNLRLWQSKLYVIISFLEFVKYEFKYEVFQQVLLPPGHGQDLASIPLYNTVMKINPCWTLPHFHNDVNFWSRDLILVNYKQIYRFHFDSLETWRCREYYNI